ncbi:MAG: hypothetical protein ACRDRR_00390 [Pseudonocardiaceae bacterium]
MSATMHRWRLVAPWYRWERLDGAEPERADGAGRPALHKYTSTEFVTEYMNDPQRSVLFETLDQHHRLEAIPHVPLPGDIRDRRRFLSTKRLVPTGFRKLFRVAHQRHYVVAVGLHCDEPGFPRVDPGDVAEAGFVVRRQRVTIPDGQEATAAALLQELATAKAVARTQVGYDTVRSRARVLHRFGSPARNRVVNPGAAAVAAQREVELARRALRVWAASVGVEARTEGWVPTGEGSFGEWVPIDDEPEELVERRYSMRPLSPPPGDPDHAAHDGTIFWGVVPTASDEVTQDGSARFAELSTYELRAFVRVDLGDCPGPLVWSTPSETFHLASFYDPDGCTQRPTEIRLPDFAQLEAGTALPSVKMTSPPDSSFLFDDNGEIPKAGSVGAGREICFFAIPLLTIVVMFLLKLFLPIITFVFNLSWMLKLKFCIPPSVDLEVKLKTELGVVPGGIEASLSVDIDVLPGVDHGEIETALRTGLNPPLPDPPLDPDELPPPPPDPPLVEVGTILTEAYTNDPLVELLASQGYGAPADQPFPMFTRPLTHTTAVTREQVRHP